MNFWVNLLNILQATMTTPTSYGWFHFMWVGIIVITTTLLCYFGRNVNDRQFRRIIFFLWLAMTLFEIYKQFMFTFSVEDGKVVAEYMWYQFPFQLCGTPIFVVPFIIWGKEGKFRDAIMAFMCFFSFFGGLVSYIYPEDLFISTICINLQTMFHHGSQIVFGLFIATYLRKRFNFSLYLKGLYTFAVLCGIALVMDIGMYHVFQALDIDHTFNMFFISPYFDCTLPVLDSIYKKIPYIPFLATYILGFGVIGVIMFTIQKGCIKMATRTKKV